MANVYAEFEIRPGSPDGNVLRLIDFCSRGPGKESDLVAYLGRYTGTKSPRGPDTFRGTRLDVDHKYGHGGKEGTPRERFKESVIAYLSATGQLALTKSPEPIRKGESKTGLDSAVPKAPRAPGWGTAREFDYPEEER